MLAGRGGAGRIIRRGATESLVRLTRCAMSERQAFGERASTLTPVLLGAVALAAAAGAVFSGLITGTAWGALLGALGMACFGGKNAVISTLKPRLPVALGVGAAGGFAGGWCLLSSLAAEQPGWLGGIAGAGIGAAEVFFWWRRRRMGRP